uniref:Uncharacterized protein n=1 Tax=viral metagenome TaxID=1070528 RepID=A0A6M3IFA3_9ZZZZ
MKVPVSPKEKTICPYCKKEVVLWDALSMWGKGGTKGVGPDKMMMCPKCNKVVENVYEKLS